jgi:pimeloyl-ACP methyl ester carboxylesterase
VRHEIHTLCECIARNIYRAKLNQVFLYDDIIIVGHSLGSVIAYDTLNTLLVSDAITCGALRVKERTRLFLTVGSPLDKVTYLYSSQTTETSYRNALDSAFAPMQSCAEARNSIPWVNLRAAWDPIAGPLDYFDPYPHEENAPRAVANITESDAPWNPIEAHTNYWRRAELQEILCAAIAQTSAAPGHASPARAAVAS